MFGSKLILDAGVERLVRLDDGHTHSFHHTPWRLSVKVLLVVWLRKHVCHYQPLPDTPPHLNPSTTTTTTTTTPSQGEETLPQIPIGGGRKEGKNGRFDWLERDCDQTPRKSTHSLITSHLIQTSLFTSLTSPDTSLPAPHTSPTLLFSPHCLHLTPHPHFSSHLTDCISHLPHTSLITSLTASHTSLTLLSSPHCLHLTPHSHFSSHLTACTSHLPPHFSSHLTDCISHLTHTTLY
ncbi:hypothetical protein Pcinc_031934 [Petrolisthes cinctipes]|uniref:Uncharacterized protein n=1 Tax=Petrolisthes cinctipes TaxID=88211 RepID=A0AAE1K2A5_PETCI|nr:hypothetical protein Pcinc_031934 [Petrolisthes cinctipes]